MSAVPARLSRMLLVLAPLGLVAGDAAGVADAHVSHRARQARPHVWVKSPRPRATVEGSVPCHFVVRDRRGIRKVRFSLDGRHLNTRFSWPYNCRNSSAAGLDTRGLANGRHQMSLRAWNGAGRSRLVRYSFFVEQPGQASTSNGGNRSSRPSGDLLFDGAHTFSFNSLQEAAPDRIQEVADPLGGPDRALRFRVRENDVYPLTPTDAPRAQALTSAFINPGMEFWVKDSFMLPSSFPSDIPWVDLMEVYGPPFNGSSPLALAVNSDEIMAKRNSTYGYDKPWSMPLVRNRWISYLLHERFGRDGWVELWIDGQRITFPNGEQRLYMATQDRSNNGGPNHVKIANYRSIGATPELTLFHKGFRVGRTRESVLG